jgi:undecaprenyl-diphosphatase
VESVIENVLSVPVWLALLIVFLAPFAEAAVFLGVVFPGEIAVLLGGVLASGKVAHADSHPSLAAVLAAAISGAILGDQVGYLVGREWGLILLRKIPDRLLPEEHLQASREAIQRLGAKAVIVGRWTAALRAFVPGLAGVSGMHYRKFLIANVIGGTLWATTCVLIGYVAGANWKHAYHLLSRYSEIVLALVVLALIGWLLRVIVRRRRRRAATEVPDTLDEGPRGDQDHPAAVSAHHPDHGES